MSDHICLVFLFFCVLLKFKVCMFLYIVRLGYQGTSQWPKVVFTKTCFHGKEMIFKKAFIFWFLLSVSIEFGLTYGHYWVMKYMIFVQYFFSKTLYNLLCSRDFAAYLWVLRGLYCLACIQRELHLSFVPPMLAWSFFFFNLCPWPFE